MNEHVQKNKRAYPTAGISTCKRSRKSIANCRHRTKQVQDEDQAKFKMSVGIDVTSCADNTNNKNLDTVTVKDIRGRLDRILATGSGVIRGVISRRQLRKQD